MTVAQDGTGRQRDFFGTFPMTRSKLARTSASVSRTWRSRVAKSGSSPARASRSRRPRGASSGLNGPVTRETQHLGERLVEAKGRQQDVGLGRRQQPGARRRGKRRLGLGREDARMIVAVNELEVLGDEFDVDQAARA